MTGTALPAAGYFTGSITNSQAKTAQNAQLAFIRQSLLGGQAETQITIATGIVTPTGACHSIETEAAAAADDLTNIAVTNMIDGQFLLIRATNGSHVVTLKNAAGGSGQMTLKGGADLVLNSTGQWVLFKLTTTTWLEVDKNFDPMFVQGGTVAGTANAITLTGAVGAYQADQRVSFKIGTTNTSGTVTLNINGLGTKSIKKISLGGSATPVALAVGDLPAGHLADMIYDGTQFILLGVRQSGQGADIATASTLDLSSCTGPYISLTGTTTVTAVTLPQGVTIRCKATSAFQITHGSSLLCPNAENVTLIAGDVVDFTGEASGVVRITHAYLQRVIGAPSGRLLQRVRAALSTVTTLSTTIPYDDTIPQIGEGTEVLTCAITPKSASSVLVVTVWPGLLSSSITNDNVALAVFRDATANAIGAAGVSSALGGIILDMSPLICPPQASGSTASTTFRARMGATGTLTVNGAAATRFFGGVSSFVMTVEEYEA